ncbi:MAG TPA: CGNR zinc finger domain-containing protein [Pedomonas sp.]|uniref:CGNR zinc finger domain-containing protein n=1 Tax=Pedomonas sp. TaxID=2976421 RepID=UPI002F3F212F
MTGKHAFIAGSLSLCLVDTLGGRGGAGVERLTGPEDLREWLVSAGLAVQPLPAPSDEDVANARALREAIHRCGLAVLAKAPMMAGDLAILNGWSAHPPLRPQFTGQGLTWQAREPVKAALSTLAADAIETLAPPKAARIRVCPECRMMFLDNSRAGRRQWCSSATGCGNRAKVRSHRARISRSSNGGSP